MVRSRGTVRLPLRGGCLCGAVRYDVNAAPLIVYACHCQDCQTRSGSAFALTVVVRSADLCVSGDTEVVRMTAPSGRELDHSFCPACRVRLFVRAIEAPDYASLRAGTFDDASWAVPIAQTFVESAIPWAVMPEVRPVAPADFDFFALGAEWRRSAPSFQHA